MKFGFILEDHEMKVAPAIRNAMNETIEELKKNGHEVVEFKFPKLFKFRNFFFQLITITQYLQAVVKRLGKESEIPQMSKLL